MDRLIKFFTAVNTFLIRLTRGRIGGKLGKQSILLLHTVGRKSGKEYVTPITYFRDGDSYLVVASNWGKEKHPEWFQNLLCHPRTTVEVEGVRLQVTASQADERDYPRLWQVVTSRNPQYLQYQKGLARQIPIVVLNRI